MGTERKHKIGRDLNDKPIFSGGDAESIQYQGYSSHNTEQFDIAEVKTVFLTLPAIQNQLAC